MRARRGFTLIELLFAVGTTVKLFLCPSDKGTPVSSGYRLAQFGPTNYAACTGSGTNGGSPYNANGIFHANSRTRITDILDGSSNTVALSESLLGEGEESSSTPYGGANAQTAYGFLYSGVLSDTACAAPQSWNLSNRPGDGGDAARPLVGLAGNLGTGWLASRWPLGKLLGAAMLLLAAALLAFPLVRTLPQVYLYAAAMGLAGGMITVLFFAVWGRVFGPAHLGRIQGAAQMLTVLASAVGPLLAALCQRQSGSYVPLFQFAAVAAGLLGLAAWRVPLSWGAAVKEGEAE